MPFVASAMKYIDDVTVPIMRFFGKKSGVEPLGYESPSQMIAALHDPSLEAMAVERMRSLYYGHAYKNWDRPFGPQENILRQRTMFSNLAENELFSKGKGFGGADLEDQ